MNLISLLRYEISLPKWLIPPQRLQSIGRFFWELVSALFTIIIMLFVISSMIPSPYEGFLLIIISVGYYANAKAEHKIWLTQFTMKEIREQLYFVFFLLGGLAFSLNYILELLW